jgi:glyoxylase-like metal-dependent hydrolase (beta-lactamase superfamily II)
MTSTYLEPPKQATNGRSGVYHFNCGEEEAWGLFDHSIWGEPIQQFAVGVADSTIAELMDRHFLPSNRLQLASTPLLWRWRDEHVLVDTGIGSQLPGMAGLLQPQLATLNLRPEDIDIVLMTHLHADHIGGAFDPASGRSIFPNAQFFISEAEIEFWSQPKPDLGDIRDVPAELIHFTIQCAQQTLSILEKQIKPFKPGTELLPGITGIALPGHTPGQSGFDFKSGGEEFLTVGDAMHDPILHLTHPEWTSMGDSSRAKTAETRGTLLSALARDQVRFHAYHFPFPGIGRVRAIAHGAYEFVSERWWWEG